MATKLILPEKTSDLDKIQVGWLNFGNLKQTTFDALEKDELAVQLILKDFNDIEELDEAQEKLKQAKALATESEGRRLYFTNLLKDKVITPSMAFEKRNEDVIKKAESHEFTLRKSASVKQEAENLKTKERSSLRAHIENEYFRIAAKYREDLEVLVLESYKNALYIKTPVKEIKPYKKAIEGFLNEVKLDKFIKFETKHITKEESIEIFKSIAPYDKSGALKASIKSIEDVFSMYAEDLKNRTKAMKKVDKDTEQVKKDAEKEVSIQTSITNLQAESVPLIMSGGPTIRKKLKVVEENTAEWAVEVMAQYLKSLDKAKQFIRVGSWAKLNIGQMAAAIAKVKSENPNFYKSSNLKFEEEEK